MLLLEHKNVQMIELDQPAEEEKKGEEGEDETGINIAGALDLQGSH